MKYTSMRCFTTFKRAVAPRVLNTVFHVVPVFLFVLAAPANAQVVSKKVYEALNQHRAASVIVILKEPDAPPSDLASRSREIVGNSIRVLSKLGAEDFELVYLWQGINAFAGIVSLSGLSKLEADPDVVRVVLDTGGRGGLAQSVPLINGDIVRSFGFTGMGVVVAILDTGVDSDHPDLSGDIIDQQCFCRRADQSGCCPGGFTERSGPLSAEDDNGHGTNIAGIITSEGIVAPIGVAPDAQIIVVKVLDSSNRFTFISQILSGLNWIIMNHPEVDVINMSLGTDQLFTSFCDNESAGAALKSAVDTLKSNGVFISVSSMNDGSKDSIAAPACLTSTIAVSAVFDADVGASIRFNCVDISTAADVVPCFANTNEIVDLMAPGSEITSSGPAGRTLTQSGTSQAAAHVSGAAAVLLAVDPTLSPDEVLGVLESTGVIVTDSENDLSFPRINLLAAVNSITGSGGEDCDDGADNDGNGRIDCADEACDGIERDDGSVCEFELEQTCNDGFDNDADGDVDNADSDCTRRNRGSIRGLKCSLSGAASSYGGDAALNLFLVLISALPVVYRRIKGVKG